MINTSRRSLIIGLGASLVAAPAIVRASSLMKVKPISPFIDPVVAAELAKPELLWLPQMKGYQIGDIVELDMPQNWTMVPRGRWRVIGSLTAKATEGTTLERVI